MRRGRSTGICDPGAYYGDSVRSERDCELGRAGSENYVYLLGFDHVVASDRDTNTEDEAEGGITWCHTESRSVSIAYNFACGKKKSPKIAKENIFSNQLIFTQKLASPLSKIQPGCN
jgi:hypothetical protein